MAKHKAVTLTEIKINHYVRKGINQDHVLMLAELYEAALADHKDDLLASQAVAPIVVTEELELVDGRHRKEAMELAGLKSAKVQVAGALTDLEIITQAAKANVGGSLPPSREDIQFMVGQLLSKFGLSAPKIREQLNWLPRAVVDRYIKVAQGQLMDIKRKLALADIAAGVGLKEAAKRRGVPEEQLIELVSGRKVKSKVGVAQIKGTITASFKTWGASVSRIINKVMEEYRNGEISEQVAEEAIATVEHLVNRLLLRAVDYRNRLRAVKTGAPLDEDAVMHSRGVGKEAE